MRVPREVKAIGDRFVASIVHYDQFPLVVRKSLISECADALLEVIPAWVVSANDDGERRSQRVGLLETHPFDAVLRYATIRVATGGG